VSEDGSGSGSGNGNPWYRYHVSQRPKARSSKVLKTLPAADASPTLSQAVVQAVKAPHRPVLVVISGNEMGLRLRIEQSVLIGRDPDCHLVLSDGLVSSRHALLEDRGDSWTLIDLGSTNGTSVNGEKGNEFVLEQNDKVVFGRTVARFEMQDSLEQAYDELVEKLLNVDDLSGLLVRRKFDADLNVAIETARAREAPLGLLMMDLDGIKTINDTHGHLFGAYVIGESGRVIGRVLEGRGFASRFGGDEFVAALPGLDVAGACALAEEIRRAIGEHEFVRESISLRPGISIGVAAFPQNASDMNRLFQQADEALYRAKRAGKNQVSC
jgi:two-component system cell cycle response regulator